MLKINTWQELEQFAKKLLRLDNPRTTPLSGATKTEEDVVGNTIVCQCKFTDNKNLSILASDISRLESASELLQKTPLLITRSSSGTFLSFLVSDEDNTAVNIIIIKNMLDNILFYMRRLNSKATTKTINHLLKEAAAFKMLAEDINDEIESKYKEICNIGQARIDDVQMVNLFEQENETCL
jgi:hypothetical protein